MARSLKPALRAVQVSEARRAEVLARVERSRAELAGEQAAYDAQHGAPDADTAAPAPADQPSADEVRN